MNYENFLEIYSDGACNKKGEGGAGSFVILNDSVELLSSYRTNDTTNNRMELIGLYIALKYAFNYMERLSLTHTNILIYTDSKYVQEGINSWLANWKTNNWRNSARKEVANQDLWKLVDEYIHFVADYLKAKDSKLEVKWVKGHSDNVGNEISDFVATLDNDICELFANDNATMKDRILDILSESYASISDNLYWNHIDVKDDSVSSLISKELFK